MPYFTQISYWDHNILYYGRNNIWLNPNYLEKGSLVCLDKVVLNSKIVSQQRKLSLRKIKKKVSF